MMRRRPALLGLAALAALPAAVRAQGTPAAAPLGDVRQVGPDRYQVGRIVVDKRAGSFVVPGRTLALGQPLEYLATSPGGVKGYESLLELDATGSELNLACILVGLEAVPDQVQMIKQSDAPGLKGQRIQLWVSWTLDGRTHRLSAAEALGDAKSEVQAASVNWVYVGSMQLQGPSRFAADETGTLIGFVHDVNSVIESVNTIGVGAYGSIRGNSRLPPKGSAVELIVETRPTPSS